MKRHFLVSFLLFVLMVSCEDPTQDNKDPVPTFLQGVWNSENSSQLYWDRYKFTTNTVNYYVASRPSLSQGMTVHRNDTFTVVKVHDEGNGNYRIETGGNDNYRTFLFSTERDYFTYNSIKFIKSND
jgi:hypothetical protein